MARLFSLRFWLRVLIGIALFLVATFIVYPFAVVATLFYVCTVPNAPYQLQSLLSSAFTFVPEPKDPSRRI